MRRTSLAVRTFMDLVTNEVFVWGQRIHPLTTNINPLPCPGLAAEIITLLAGYPAKQQTELQKVAIGYDWDGRDNI